MKILVTGCAGFIGFHLARRLLNEGHSVVGVDNLNDYYPPQLKYDRLGQLGVDKTYIEPGSPVHGKDGFKFIKLDIEDSSSFGRCLKDERLDAVCHLAAQAGVRYSIENPQAYISSNIQGFFNVLEYCRLNPEMKLVFASSSSVYGKNTSMPCREEDNTDYPVSLYAATKKSNEVMACAYSELYGLEAVGLRFFTVYGPWGRPDMAPLIFTKAVLESKPVKLFNNGNMSRDFTYIDDIVEGICRVLFYEPASGKSRSERFRIYNIGNSKPVDIERFVSAIETVTRSVTRRTYLPMQSGDVKSTWADTSRLRNDYGNAPDTPLIDGITALVDWYISYYQKEPDAGMQPKTANYI